LAAAKDFSMPLAAPRRIFGAPEKMRHQERQRFTMAHTDQLNHPKDSSKIYQALLMDF
jgi:hypothetical protein